VRTLQREGGRIVVEDCRRPRSRVVAACAIGKRKSRSGRLMRRIIRLLPGGQMASRATAGCRQGTCVIVVDVASGTGRRYVGAREREIGLSVVVKICRRPRSRVVAACAIGKRKSRPGRLMRRIIRLLPGGQMASRATAGRRQGTCVIVIDVAGGARRVYMSPGKREIRVRVVVELGVRPSIEGMASGAIRGGKSRSR